MKVVESKSSIIIISYHNCELYCCHLDGYKSNKDALLKRLTKIETEFSAKPTHLQFRIWYNIDENNLDKAAMKLITESICRFQSRIYKIAFIGLRGIKRWIFDHELEKRLGNKVIIKAYFIDAELAKGWLV